MFIEGNMKRALGLPFFISFISVGLTWFSGNLPCFQDAGTPAKIVGRCGIQSDIGDTYRNLWIIAPTRKRI